MAASNVSHFDQVRNRERAISLRAQDEIGNDSASAASNLLSFETRRGYANRWNMQ